MSVPNQTPYIIYNANGLTTVFPFEFYIINAADLQVSINGTTLTSGYSVSGTGNVGGGAVTFITPPASGSVVMLERVVPTYRLTDYQDNGDLLADTVNKDFDRLWMAIQRSFIYLGLALRRPLLGGPFNAEGYRISALGDPVNDQDAVTKKYLENNALVRTLRVPEPYVDPLPAAVQRANKLLAFDSSGKPIVVLPESGSASEVLIYLASQNGASAIGTQGGVNIQQWFENDFIARWGGKPDYTGTPLYDGNDSARITATDNSPMLQNALNSGVVRNGVLHIYFPAGHYGFKTDGVAKVASSNVHTVIFHGESFESTTLDFIFERSDTIGTNVQPSNASMLTRLTGFKRVIWKNVRCKCTTKSGTIDGSTDPSADNPSVYYGAVWFAHMQDCENVRFESVKMQRGNYRGFSVDAQNLPIGYRTKVSIVNCEGFENTSTGYWLSFCNSLYVQGGQFYHNGTKGFLATGYGIAASQYVDDILIVGCATFYENYRKGFDRHGGIGSMVIHGAIFADNLLRDIEDNKQYNQQYDPAKLNYNHYSNCQFLINRNPSWLSEALAAVNYNTSCIKAFVSILDRLIAGTIAGKQREILFSNCNFKVIGNVPDGYVGFNGFSLEAPISTYDNCVIDTTGFRLASTVSGNVYSSFMFGSVHDNALIRFRNTSVKTHPGAIVHPSSGELSNSVLFTVQPTTVIEADSATSFDLNNFIFAGVTGGGNVSQWLGQRKFNGCEFKFRDAKMRTQNQTVTNAFSWINNGFGLKGSNGNNYVNNCSIGFGDCKNMSPINGAGGYGAIQRFTIPAQSKASGNTGKILTGKVDSNLQIELKGGMELAAETFKATWRYSAWTKNLITASPTINIDRPGTLEAITYNGIATNFLAQPLTISWTASTGDTAWYDGTASATESYLPLIISIS